MNSIYVNRTHKAQQSSLNYKAKRMSDFIHKIQIINKKQTNKN